MYNSKGELVASNDDHRPEVTTPPTRWVRFPSRPAASMPPWVAQPLAGAYSAMAKSRKGSGTVLVEAYEVDSSRLSGNGFTTKVNKEHKAIHPGHKPVGWMTLKRRSVFAASAASPRAPLGKGDARDGIAEIKPLCRIRAPPYAGGSRRLPGRRWKGAKE